MIEIIPAIDIIEGRCVRLSQGDYGRRTTYDYSPVEMARRFLDNGFTRIHLVDLDGAKAGECRNLRTLEAVASLPGARVEWGGGIKSDASLRDTLNAGATFAIIGSIAANNPGLMRKWLSERGGDVIVLGADVRSRMVAVNGWLDQTDISIHDLIDGFKPCGLTQAICTDISKDGMLQGPSGELYAELRERHPDVVFTVSGGIGSIADIEAMEALGMTRVITGKALYEGRFTLEELSRFNA